MKKFSKYLEEGKITASLVKGLGMLLRNKLSKKIQEGKSGRTTAEKMDSLFDAMGIVGSMGLMNIALEDKGESLMSRGVIVRGLIEEFNSDGTLSNQETKELLND